MYFLSVAGFIACKDASPFEAFSCPSTPSSPFYKLLEIERRGLPLRRLAQVLLYDAEREEGTE